MSAYDVGTGIVQIVPSFRGVAEAIKAEAEKWARSIESTLSSAVRQGLNGGAAGAGAQGGKAGAAYGQSFADTVRARISAALKNLPNPKIDVNSTAADRKIVDLRAQLRSLQANVGVNVDSAEALARITSISAELQALTANDPNVDVRVNTARATAQLAALQAELDTVDKDRTLDIRLEGGFAQRVKAQIEAALANLPTGVIDLDTGKANTELEALRARLETLGGRTIGVDIDAGRARAELAAIGAELKALGGRNANIDVRIDAARAEAELAAIEGEITALNGQSLLIDVSEAIGGFNGLLVAGIALGAALIPIGAAITAAFAGVALAIAGIVAAVGVVALAIAPVIKAIAGMSAAHKKAATDAAASAKAQQASAQQVASAQRAVASAEAGLAQARANAADQAVTAAQRVKDAEQGLADATRTSSRDQQKALRDVSDAEAALWKARRSARLQAEDDTKAIGQAEKALAKAQLDAADALASADERVAQARQGEADAVRDGARSITAALATQHSAEESLAKAQRDALKLQTDLTKARKDAQQQLEDLAAAAQDGVLSERQAILDLQDAKDALAKAKGQTGGASSGQAAHDALFGTTTPVTPASSAEDIAKAQLAYDKAQQSLTEIQTQNARVASQQADATAKGVEGSDQVVAAQQAITDNVQATADAQAAADQAALDVDAARAKAAEDLSKAQQQVADALTAQSRAQRDAADSQAAAQDAVTAAHVQADRDAQTSAEAVAAAQRDVADATVRAQQVQATGAENTAKAQEQLTTALREQQTQQRNSAFSIASALAGVAAAQASLGNAVAKAKEQTKPDDSNNWLDGLTRQGRLFFYFIKGQLLPALHGFSDVAQNGLLPGLQAGLQALLPFVPQIKTFVGQLAATLGDLFEKAGKALTSPFWRQFFGYLAQILPGVIQQLGDFTGGVLTGLAGLLQGLGPSALTFGKAISDAGVAFGQWAQNLGQDKGFQGFLSYVQQSLPVVGAFLGSMVGLIGAVVKVAAPFGLLLLEVFTTVANAIAALPTPVLAVLAIAIGAVALAFIGPETGVLAAITLIVLAFTAIGIGVTYLITHFGDVVDSIRNAVGPAFSWLKDNVLAPVGAAFTALWRDVFVPGWKHITDAFSTAYDYVSGAFTTSWNKVTGIVTAPLGLAKTALDTSWGLIEKAFTATYDWVHDVFTKSWDLVKGILLAPIDLAKAELSLAGKGFEAIKDAFSAVYGWVSGVFKRDWDLITGILTGPVNAAKNALTDAGTGVFAVLQQAFTDFVAGVKTVWDGLQDIAKAPIKFIIETVLNDGLIGAFNSVSSKLGGPEIKTVPLPKGFAAGGPIEGPYLGARADNVLIRANPREFMQPVHAVDYYGADFMEALRHRMIPREALPGFAGGGIIGNAIGSVASGAKRVAGGAARAVKGAWDLLTSPTDYIKGRIEDLIGQVTDAFGTNELAQLAAAVPRALATSVVDKVKSLVGFGSPDGTAWLKPTSGPYGEAIGPEYGGTGYAGHTGQDFPVPVGTSVFATLAGAVVKALDIGDRSYGRYITLDHGKGFESLYAHLSRMDVAQGDAVGRGQQIALSGNYGNTTGPHLHFEIRKDGTPVNPVPYLMGSKTFDNGGYLDPGLQLIYNGTGAPEPVLTTEQLSGLTQRAASSSSASRDLHYYAAQGRSSPRDDVLVAMTRADFLTAG